MACEKRAFDERMQPALPAPADVWYVRVRRQQLRPRTQLYRLDANSVAFRARSWCVACACAAWSGASSLTVALRMARRRGDNVVAAAPG